MSSPLWYDRVCFCLQALLVVWGVPPGEDPLSIPGVFILQHTLRASTSQSQRCPEQIVNNRKLPQQHSQAAGWYSCLSHVPSLPSIRANEGISHLQLHFRSNFITADER